MNAFTEYYTDLLGTCSDTKPAVDSRVLGHGSRVSSNDRALLVQEFDEKDVKKVLWIIDGDKAPGPDGFGS